MDLGSFDGWRDIYIYLGNYPVEFVVRIELN